MSLTSLGILEFSYHIKNWAQSPKNAPREKPSVILWRAWLSKTLLTSRLHQQRASSTHWWTSILQAELIERTIRHAHTHARALLSNTEISLQLLTTHKHYILYIFNFFNISFFVDIFRKHLQSLNRQRTFVSSLHYALLKGALTHVKTFNTSKIWSTSYMNMMSLLILNKKNKTNKKKTARVVQLKPELYLWLQIAASMSNVSAR